MQAGSRRENCASDRLHPTHGLLPDAKLVSQPPLQLLADLSNLANFPCIESGATDGDRAAVEVRVADDLRCDVVVLVADWFDVWGFAARSGAFTVTPGSEVGLWAATGPLTRLAVKIAMTEGTKNPDDSFMTISPRDGNAVHCAQYAKNTPSLSFQSRHLVGRVARAKTRSSAMKAYLVLDITVHDHKRFKADIDAIAEIIARHLGETRLCHPSRRPLAAANLRSNVSCITLFEVSTRVSHSQSGEAGA